MTLFLKSVTKIRSEFDSSLFFLRSRQNVAHPKLHIYNKDAQNYTKYAQNGTLQMVPYRTP